MVSDQGIFFRWPKLPHRSAQSDGSSLHHHRGNQRRLDHQRRQPEHQRQARQLADPDPVQEPQQQDGDHRQDRDLVRPGVQRRDVVQRADDRDGDGQQIGADHERARDHADARPERLDGSGDAAAPLRVAMRDLEVLDRHEDEGDRGDEHEHRRERPDLRVEDAGNVKDRGPEVGEHHRPGQQRPQVPDPAISPPPRGSPDFDLRCWPQTPTVPLRRHRLCRDPRTVATLGSTWGRRGLIGTRQARGRDEIWRTAAPAHRFRLNRRTRPRTLPSPCSTDQRLTPCGRGPLTSASTT